MHKIKQQKEGETGNEASGAWHLIGREYICMAEVISTVHLIVWLCLSQCHYQSTISNYIVYPGVDLFLCCFC